MKLGIVSDIHCNVATFRRALTEMAGTVDEVLVAGDAVFEYRMSNEVVEMIREAGARYVLGNHEMVLMSSAGARARAMPDVRQANLDVLAATPERIDVTVDGKRLVMVHGSPFEPHREYLYRTSRTLRRVDELDVDVLVLGHTHVPMAERFGRTLVVNPGSIGDSRSSEPGRPVTYAVLDTGTEEVEFTSFPSMPAEPAA